MCIEPESKAYERATIPEDVMLGRLAQSEQMREFFIEMWRQNPALARQGGATVENLLTPLVRNDANEKLHESSGKVMGGQRGISLVELIIFIVIISTALAGILLVMNQVTAHSADPLIRKQALAVAESLLEEVELMPFTFCDPDDASAATAVSAVVAPGGCAAIVEVLGTEGEGARALFDNVSDYAGFGMAAGALQDITGTPAVAGYAADIAVAPAALFGIAATDADGAPQVLQITVTVTGPDGEAIVLDGYRTRYAPRI